MKLFNQMTEKEQLNEEWVILIQTAQKMGLSVEEVRMFLNDCGQQTAIHQKQSEADYKRPLQQITFS